mmetsp:Transcript_12149/g.35539  ORF Transcript_12149/g.35539 Transcript_12149/m.35539 type:complete len:293 (-) Transcript_12149:2849-3727(-)
MPHCEMAPTSQRSCFFFLFGVDDETAPPVLSLSLLLPDFFPRLAPPPSAPNPVVWNFPIFDFFLGMYMGSSIDPTACFGSAQPPRLKWAGTQLRSSSLESFSGSSVEPFFSSFSSDSSGSQGGGGGGGGRLPLLRRCGGMYFPPPPSPPPSASFLRRWGGIYFPALIGFGFGLGGSTGSTGAAGLVGTTSSIITSPCVSASASSLSNSRVSRLGSGGPTNAAPMPVSSLLFASARPPVKGGGGGSGTVSGSVGSSISSSRKSASISLFSMTSTAISARFDLALLRSTNMVRS